ncbi:hypothetical protein GCM10017786_50070 [Amycolatopsis deserti]|uniref:Uncharacterized protein n=1 Tax=Amycolatopsis deserti TaxID=185696 RepID=A0ABQ3J8E1_9PSEU|nr:hypothetical protein [Amycolatopsis deserti]GHF10382.1 hypothetical protein GCM10017786_50070 [Amycolatopsis deserti]
MNDLNLADLTGEVLPERAVLGVVATPFSGGSSASSSSAAAAGGNTVIYDGGNHGAVSTSACQATHAEGTPGLVGSLGLGSNNPSESLTCVPASTATY